MNLIYQVKDKPPVLRLILLSLQQLLAILAATIAVPMIVGEGMSTAAALFGAGAGTIIYQLFTKFRSPVFLGSSFAFIDSMVAAFSGATTAAVCNRELGYLGLLIGALLAGLVYVLLALIIKFCGVKWISKLMTPVVIGPTVAIIGLTLAGSAVGNLTVGNVVGEAGPTANTFLCLLCGLVTLFVTIICSVYGKKMMKMIPFIIGILSGYLLAAVFTVIGNIANVPELQIINFSLFETLKEGKNWLPDFTFVTAFKGFEDMTFGYFGTIAVAYIPVAFVVFAEHIADHKNLSSIIGSDLLEEPGLSRTLLGDGVGSMAGAFFGGCPNTTYGESVGCVAISGNASVLTITVTAFMAMVAAFVAPFITFLATIPSCVMGGVCIALYGFIAVSGLKMLKNVDLGENRNLFVVSTILICGVGGLVVTFGEVKVTSIACALILGILVNVVVNIGGKKTEKADENADQTNEENK